VDFFQVRGSIPVIWKQPAVWGIKVNRPITIEQNLSKNVRACLLHLDRDIVSPYVRRESFLKQHFHPGVVFLNLVDKCGSEGLLGRWQCGVLYEAQQLCLNSNRSVVDSWNNTRPQQEIESFSSGTGESSASTLRELFRVLSDDFSLPEHIRFSKRLKDRSVVTDIDFLLPAFKCAFSTEWNLTSNSQTSLSTIPVRYIWMDYHHQMNQDSSSARTEEASLVNEVFRRLQKNLTSFHASEAGSGGTFQGTLIRTNCIDCLDRTNVVQVWFIEFLSLSC
jgi:hypothetical protein